MGCICKKSTPVVEPMNLYNKNTSENPLLNSSKLDKSIEAIKNRQLSSPIQENSISKNDEIKLKNSIEHEKIEPRELFESTSSIDHLNLINFTKDHNKIGHPGQKSIPSTNHLLEKGPKEPFDIKEILKLKTLEEKKNSKFNSYVINSSRSKSEQNEISYINEENSIEDGNSSESRQTKINNEFCYEKTPKLTATKNDYSDKEIEFEKRKTSKIFCVQCFHIQDDGVVLSTCNKCTYCSVCIFNNFNSCLNSEKNQAIECKCGFPMSYRLFQEYVLPEDISSYLGKISASNFERAENFMCKCGLVFKTIEKTNNSLQCSECKKVFCLRCLEEHDQTVTCKRFFNMSLPKCKICKTSKVKNLSCKCLICEKCYFDNIKLQLLDDPLGTPACPLCKEQITKHYLIEIFGSQNRLIKFQEDALIASRFSCPICYQEKVVNGSITLYCTHRFCSGCIKNYLELQLDSLPLTSTSIPCPTCNSEISYHIINSLLTGEALNRYYKRLVKNTKLADSQEVIKYCNQCDYAESVPIDIEKFECPVCNKTICAKCNKPFKENCCKGEPLNIDYSDSFKNLVTKCPKCSCQIMKETGCNFIKCEWPGCIGVHFCFLCKKELKVRAS